jgi:DNA-binding transcriptional regulator PaaX
VLADKPMETSNPMEQTVPVVEANDVGATSELVVVEDRHGPTSLAQYWKLDPWNQGYVVTLEAESDVSQVKSHANPYQKRSHNGGQRRTGHLSGRLAGRE